MSSFRTPSFENESFNTIFRLSCRNSKTNLAQPMPPPEAVNTLYSMPSRRPRPIVLLWPTLHLRLSQPFRLRLSCRRRSNSSRHTSSRWCSEKDASSRRPIMTFSTKTTTTMVPFRRRISKTLKTTMPANIFQISIKYSLQSWSLLLGSNRRRSSSNISRWSLHRTHTCHFTLTKSKDKRTSQWHRDLANNCLRSPPAPAEEPPPPPPWI